MKYLVYTEKEWAESQQADVNYKYFTYPIFDKKLGFDFFIITNQGNCFVGIFKDFKNIEYCHIVEE